MSLSYAIEKARMLPVIKHRQRVFACIVNKRGRIVAEAWNNYECTHPQMLKYSSKVGLVKEYLHAEISCLLRMRNIKGKQYKMYVARVGNKGTPLPAFPCVVCQQALKEASYIKSIECTV